MELGASVIGGHLVGREGMHLMVTSEAASVPQKKMLYRAVQPVATTVHWQEVPHFRVPLEAASGPWKDIMRSV